MGDDKAIYVLHKYFIWSDRMRFHFDQLLKNEFDKLKSTDTQKANMFRIELNIYMSYWYGGMFVLIEGWKALGLSDSKINDLLKSKNVDLLRQYRNGVFHFQKEYFDKRFIGFVESSDSAKWVRDLRDEFSRFFLDRLKQNNSAE